MWGVGHSYIAIHSHKAYEAMPGFIFHLKRFPKFRTTFISHRIFCVQFIPSWNDVPSKILWQVLKPLCLSTSILQPQATMSTHFCTTRRRLLTSHKFNSKRTTITTTTKRKLNTSIFEPLIESTSKEWWQCETTAKTLGLTSKIQRHSTLHPLQRSTHGRNGKSLSSPPSSSPSLRFRSRWLSCFPGRTMHPPSAALSKAN